MMRLRFMRLQSGLTYEALAEAAQVGERTIRSAEGREVTPNPATLMALARALKWPIDRFPELLEEIHDPEAPAA